MYVYLGQGHSNSITSILWLTKALDLNKYLNHDFSAAIKNNPDTPESSPDSPGEVGIFASGSKDRTVRFWKYVNNPLDNTKYLQSIGIITLSSPSK